MADQDINPYTDDLGVWFHIPSGNIETWRKDLGLVDGEEMTRGEVVQYLGDMIADIVHYWFESSIETVSKDPDFLHTEAYAHIKGVPQTIYEEEENKAKEAK